MEYKDKYEAIKAMIDGKKVVNNGLKGSDNYMYFDKDACKFRAYCPITEHREEIKELWNYNGWKEYRERLDAKIGEVVKYEDKYLAAIEEIVKGDCDCDHCYFKNKPCCHIECTNKIYVEVEL